MQQFFCLKWNELYEQKEKSILGCTFSTCIPCVPVVILSSTESEQHQEFETIVHSTSFVVGLVNVVVSISFPFHYW